MCEYRSAYFAPKGAWARFRLPSAINIALLRSAEPVPTKLFIDRFDHGEYCSGVFANSHATPERKIT